MVAMRIRDLDNSPSGMLLNGTSRVSHKNTFLDFSLPLFTIVDHWARKHTGKILDFSDFGNLPPHDLELWDLPRRQDNMG